jgi:hypothetical protein
MLRVLRLLPVILPLVSVALRNPKVRELLHLKPRSGRGGPTGRR